VQHPLAQFNAQDLEYFENFTGISLNTTKEVEPDLPMCSFREFQVAKTPKARQKINGRTLEHLSHRFNMELDLNSLFGLPFAQLHS
jgi:hypothetical protein